MVGLENDSHTSLTDAALQSVLPHSMDGAPCELCFPTANLGGFHMEFAAKDLGTGDLQSGSFPGLRNFEEGSTSDCSDLTAGLDACRSRREHPRG